MTASSLFVAFASAVLVGVSPLLSASPLASNYADIALAAYEDSLSTAMALGESVDRLLEAPSLEALAAARLSWISARVPYQQTEVYRFGNAIVDEWEGQVNAWPLDEGFVDYVSASYGTDSASNLLYVANVVANQSIAVGSRTIDASVLSPELLKSQLHEAGGSEANVATGYHAIEFLLWGQDLNGTGVGAGSRPYTDFDIQHCTNGHCARRSQYLKAVTDLLGQDLQAMVRQWRPDGAAREALLDSEQGSVLTTVLTGMGSLSYGELAGERMRLGLMLHDPEEEHDCFSDNTHNAHYYDAKGIQNVYLGEYQRVDGAKIVGASVAEIVAKVDKQLDLEMRRDLQLTMLAMQRLVERAKRVEAYDQMIAEGNKAGNAVVQAAVDALVKQTMTIERIVLALGIGAVEIADSDSLHSPDAVFQ